jgi:hypothetical protein
VPGALHNSHFHRESPVALRLARVNRALGPPGSISKAAQARPGSALTNKSIIRPCFPTVHGDTSRGRRVPSYPAAGLPATGYRGLPACQYRGLRSALVPASGSAGRLEAGPAPGPGRGDRLLGEPGGGRPVLAAGASSVVGDDLADAFRRGRVVVAASPGGGREQPFRARNGWATEMAGAGQTRSARASIPQPRPAQARRTHLPREQNRTRSLCQLQGRVGRRDRAEQRRSRGPRLDLSQRRDRATAEGVVSDLIASGMRLPCEKGTEFIAWANVT